VQGFASDEQVVPLALFASAGHVAVEPVQFSAGSHSPADGRQVTVDDDSVSGGQAAPAPVQSSAGSQAPADARQTVVDDWNESIGHVVLVPVQVSAMSQTSACARQVAPAFPAGCWQALLAPSH
jgi:hypothetical protein